MKPWMTLPGSQAARGMSIRTGDADVFAAAGKPTMGTVDSWDDLILLNDGTGKLAPFDQSLGDTDRTSIALGDVHGDGKLDALAGTTDGATLWLNQRGSPLFVPAAQSFETSQTIGSRLQAVLSAAAEKLFGLYLPYGSIRTKAVFLSDLDGDGSLDAVLARLWGAEIWWNDGIGTFRPGNR